MHYTDINTITYSNSSLPQCIALPAMFVARALISIQVMLRFSQLDVIYVDGAFQGVLNPAQARKQCWRRLRERLENAERVCNVTNVETWLDGEMTECLSGVVRACPAPLSLEFLGAGVGCDVNESLVLPVLDLGTPLSITPWRLAGPHNTEYQHLSGPPRIWYVVPAHTRARFEAFLSGRFGLDGVRAAAPLWFVPSAAECQEFGIMKLVQYESESVRVPDGSWCGALNLGYNAVVGHVVLDVGLSAN